MPVERGRKRAPAKHENGCLHDINIFLRLVIVLCSNTINIRRHATYLHTLITLLATRLYVRRFAGQMDAKTDGPADKLLSRQQFVINSTEFRVFFLLQNGNAALVHGTGC